MQKQSTISIELANLYERHGKLTASLVVDEARDKDSPLHSCFEWDTDKAAEQYLLYQARHLLRVYSIVIHKEETPQRLFHVRIEKQKEGEYHPLRVIVKDKDLYIQAKTELQNKLYSAQASLDELTNALVKQPQKKKIAEKTNRRLKDTIELMEKI